MACSPLLCSSLSLPTDRSQSAALPSDLLRVCLVCLQPYYSCADVDPGHCHVPHFVGLRPVPAARDPPHDACRRGRPHLHPAQHPRHHGWCPAHWRKSHPQHVCCWFVCLQHWRRAQKGTAGLPPSLHLLWTELHAGVVCRCPTHFPSWFNSLRLTLPLPHVPLQIVVDIGGFFWNELMCISTAVVLLCGHFGQFR